MRVVIPSVQYADTLSITLPAWQGILPASAVIRVVTSAADTETQAVAARPGVACLVTDAWTRPVDYLRRVRDRTGNRTITVLSPSPEHAPRFNKALALDEAFGFVPGAVPSPEIGEVCLALDADVYPWGSMPEESTIAADTLYGCPRYAVARQADLQRQVGPLRRRGALKLMIPRGMGSRVSPDQAAAKCLGYFQLFRYAFGFRYGSYWHAGLYDKEVRQRFAQCRALDGFVVLHLGESNEANWSGRAVARWA